MKQKIARAQAQAYGEPHDHEPLWYLRIRQLNVKFQALLQSIPLLRRNLKKSFSR